MAVALVLANALYSIVTNRGFGWPVVSEYFFSPQVMAGLFTTLMLTAISMTLALLLGIIVAVAAASRNPVLSTQLISSRTFEVIPMLLVASLWYLLVSTVLMVIQSGIERHFGKSVVRP